MCKYIILFLLVSFLSQSATIDTVISGNRYDGITATADGDFLAATAEDGQIVRFDSDGNQSIIFQGGQYMVAVTAASDGNIYASDAFGNTIYRIDSSGQQEVYNSNILLPGNIAESPDGSLLVGSFNDGNGGVFELNSANSATLIIPESQATFPLASAFDDQGNYYFAESATAEIFRLNPEGEISLFASLPINSGSFRLGHLLFADNSIYATGYSDNKVYRVSLSGEIEVVVGAGATGEAADFVLNGPAGITAGSQPYEIYVGNYNSRVVNRIQLDVPVSQQVKNPETLSGPWYDPILTGEGFNLIYAPNGLLVYYYGHDTEGNNLWLISDVYSGEINFNAPVILSFYELSGGTFNSPVRPDEAELWGSLELVFNSCSRGEFTMNGIDGIKVSMVQKLANILGIECP